MNYDNTIARQLAAEDQQQRREDRATAAAEIAELEAAERDVETLQERFDLADSEHERAVAHTELVAGQERLKRARLPFAGKTA